MRAQKMLLGNKERYYWERGRPRPHCLCSTLYSQEVGLAAISSRFALRAGEGARAPGIDGSLPAATTFWANRLHGNPGNRRDLDCGLAGFVPEGVACIRRGRGADVSIKPGASAPGSA